MAGNKLSSEQILEKVNSLKQKINRYHLDFISEAKFDSVLSDMLAAASEIFLSADAKRIRAIIPVLIAENGISDYDNVMRYGVLIELLHFCSLVHDDVIDDAKERRHRPTLNALFTNSNAVLMGDHFICESIEYALQTQHNIIVIGVSIRAVKDLITGVILEQKLAKMKIGFDEWRHMADMKTGCLFGLSFCLPFAGTDKLDAGRRVGIDFGTLFQIYDDYFDRGEDIGSMNVYNILPEKEIDRICNDIYVTVKKGCDGLGISNVLAFIVRYLQEYGYFFNIKAL
jgi:octaprenyl-diphosphate synthase